MAPPPATPAARSPRAARRTLVLQVLAAIAAVAALVVAALYPRLRQPIGLVAAGLALGYVRYLVFGAAAVPFARLGGRLFQGRRRNKAKGA